MDIPEDAIADLTRRLRRIEGPDSRRAALTPMNS